VWNAATARDYTLEGHGDEVLCVASAPMANGSPAGQEPTLKVWEVATGEEIHRSGDMAPVKSVASVRMATDGERERRLTELKLWETATGQETLTSQDPEPRAGVIFSPTGTPPRWWQRQHG